jgi:acyl-CoA thioesterase
MKNEIAIRKQLGDFLGWKEAHADFDAAVRGVPKKARGRRPSGLHSPWEILEHLRITQADILDFCRNADYQAITWPDDYWPPSATPPSDGAWARSVQQFRNDRDALQALASDTTINLTAKIPHGTGQTYLRELLLAGDHTSYHVGQLVLVRQLLGVWK